MNNKFIKLILGGLVMALLITGCGSDEDTDREEKKSKKKDKSKTEQSAEDDEAGESDEFYFIIEAKDGAHPTQFYHTFYDMEGNVMSESNAYSAEYDDEGNLRSLADTMWKYEFDEDGNRVRVLQMSIYDKPNEVSEYDKNGNRTKYLYEYKPEWDNYADVEICSYDGDLEVLRYKRELYGSDFKNRGEFDRHEYNADGTVSVWIHGVAYDDEDYNVIDEEVISYTVYEYDDHGNVLRTIRYDPDEYESLQGGTITDYSREYEYDERGNLIRMSSEKYSPSHEYEYDSKDRLIRSIDYATSSGEPVVTERLYIDDTHYLWRQPHDGDMEIKGILKDDDGLVDISGIKLFDLNESGEKIKEYTPEFNGSVLVKRTCKNLVDDYVEAEFYYPDRQIEPHFTCSYKDDPYRTYYYDESGKVTSSEETYIINICGIVEYEMGTANHNNEYHEDNELIVKTNKDGTPKEIQYKSDSEKYKYMDFSYDKDGNLVEIINYNSDGAKYSSIRVEYEND